MKKALYIISSLICIVYIVVFSLNVKDLVSMHMDYEVTYPLIVMVIGLIITVVMLIIRCFKRFENKLFIIPLFFFISCVITFIIGYLTPCTHCL